MMRVPFHARTRSTYQFPIVIIIYLPLQLWVACAYVAPANPMMMMMMMVVVVVVVMVAVVVVVMMMMMKKKKKKTCQSHGTQG